METKLFVIEIEAHTFTNTFDKIIETDKENAYFADFETARKFAEIKYKEAMKRHSETADDERVIVTDIWVQQYFAVDGMFIFETLRGHFDSWDYTGRAILSHCE